MDKEKVIQLLNKDVEDEHGAIIQYLSHAYAMGEGEMTCEIEALAREEMRHLDWLAENIVELGGVPSIKRGTMNITGTTVSDWMASDVGLEEGAIAQYKEHIKAIDDPKIQRLLRRILSDEESHHGDFKHFVEKAEREGLTDLRGTQSDKTTETLNWGIKHEYTVILQYLLQSYLTPNEEASKELEDQAINEMQHLGWLAEEVVGVQGTPVIEHSEVDRTTDTAEMLRADIKIENEVADVYNRTAGETTDEGIRKLMLRLRNHEKYHAEVFGDLLKEEETS